MLNQVREMTVTRDSEFRGQTMGDGQDIAVHDRDGMEFHNQGHIPIDGLNGEHDPHDMQALLLSALSAMAVRSKRRQADLSAALKRSGLSASRETVSAALRALEQAGCIENLVPLYDGGMLMSVTSRGIEHLNAGPCWTMMDLQRRA